MFLGLILWMFMTAQAEDVDYEVTVVPSDVKLYIDKTGIPPHLQKMISSYASLHKSMIKNKLTSLVAPSTYEGLILVLNNHNMDKAMLGCNYTKSPVRCGMKNNHWVMITTVSMEKTHATLNLFLYDEEGSMISSSSVPVWGYVQILPQYKRTTIQENTMFGPVQRTITEQYPPKRKMIPPRINSKHVSEAIMRLYLSIEVENI